MYFCAHCTHNAYKPPTAADLEFFFSLSICAKKTNQIISFFSDVKITYIYVPTIYSQSLNKEVLNSAVLKFSIYRTTHEVLKMT